MRRAILLLVGTVLTISSAGAQSVQSEGIPSLLDSPSSFRSVVDMSTTLQDLTQALDSVSLLEELSGRILILDGMVNSIAVYSEDPNDFYVEMELVSGRWEGVESVHIYKAYVFFDDPAFTGRLSERAPREPDPSLTTRNDRVIVAGRLVTVAEDPEGRPVPVIRAFELRPLR